MNTTPRSQVYDVMFPREFPVPKLIATAEIRPMPIPVLMLKAIGMVLIVRVSGAAIPTSG